MKHLYGWGAFAAILLCPHQVSANPLDAFGLGGRGPAMANAQIADARDISATYYNPASMFLVPAGEGLDTFALTSLAALDRFRIRDPAGRDIANPSENVYEIGGGLLDGLGTDWFRLGVTFMLPVTRLQLQRTHYIDEREANGTDRLDYEFYGQRLQRQIILPTVAFRPIPQLALGGGISVFQLSNTSTSVFLRELADQSKAELNLNADQENTFSPIFGFLILPTDDLRIGGVYRDTESFPIRGGSHITINSEDEFVNGLKVLAEVYGKEFLDEAVQEVNWRIQFRPSQAGLGAAYDAFPNVSLAGDVMWYRWSRYRDNHNERPTPRFHDTYSPRLGAEYRWSEIWQGRLGYAFEPTPVPRQAGRTNIVDSNKHVVGVGVSYRHPLDDYFAVFDLFFQGHVFEGQTVRKEELFDTLPSTAGVQNPGYPGFDSEGEIYSFGLTFSLMR